MMDTDVEFESQLWPKKGNKRTKNVSWLYQVLNKIFNEEMLQHGIQVFNDTKSIFIIKNIVL